MSDAYEPPPPYEARDTTLVIPQPTTASATETRPAISPRSATSASTRSPTSSRSISTINEPGAFTSSGPGLESKAAWSTSSPHEIDIWLDLKSQLPDLPNEPIASVREYALDPIAEAIPSLNVVIFAIGPPTEVAPLIALASHLVTAHGHTVRIVTHSRHEGSIKRAVADITRRQGKKSGHAESRLQYFGISDMMEDGQLSAWSSKPSELKAALSDLHRSTHSLRDEDNPPFVPDLIVANPLSMAHVHIAEWAGVPLHIMSTSPWSPTNNFTHPSINIRQSNTPRGLTNYLSYALVDNLLWRELGGVINSLRAIELGLSTLNGTSGPGALDRLKIPFSYTWSQAILQTPEDWPEHIDVTGFVIGDASRETVDNELIYFLKEGRPPTYVFLDLTARADVAQKVLRAIGQVHARAIIHVIGADVGQSASSEVFVVSDKFRIPLRWLVTEERISTVIHGGEAEMVAAALLGGVPSVVISSSADANFLNKRVADLRAGSPLIHIDNIEVGKLVLALEHVSSPEVKLAVREVGYQIKAEDGVGEAARSIHRHLPLQTMRCDLISSQVALWYHPDLCLRLSAIAAGVLVGEGKLEYRNLLPNRPKEHPVSQVSTDPAVGGVQSFFVALTNSVANVMQLLGRSSTSNVVDTSVHQLAVASRQVPHPSSGVWRWEYEGEDRTRGEVTDVKSGMREARDELMAGVRDGVKGLVMEPWKGVQRAGPIGGVTGMIHGSIGLFTRPLASSVRAIGMGAQGATSEYKAAQSRGAVKRGPSESLRLARKQMSNESIESLDWEDTRRILQAYKRAKMPAQVFARHERMESVLRGADIKSVSDARIVLGEKGRLAQAEAEHANLGEKSSSGSSGGAGGGAGGGGGGSGNGKWWKGKGKARDEPRRTTSAEAKNTKEAEVRAMADRDARRRNGSGPSGEQ